MWHTRRDGKVFPTLMHNTLVRNAAGTPIAFLGTLRDIAEMKKVEEALRRQRDEAQKYLDVAGVILVAIDPRGMVRLINKKGCEIPGYDEEEIIGKDWFGHFIPDRMREQVKEVFLKLMAGQIEPMEYFENPVLGKDDRESLIARHERV